jgi:sugar/nucleoside kinase (ribokinase family)
VADKQPDVISIGDIVTDAFIKLIDDQAVTYENEQGKWIAMQYGTKLPFDHAEIIEEYDYHWPHLTPAETPQWVYFSSISEHAIPYHDQVADWLEANPSVKMAFQPGTFQMEAGAERLQRIYARTEVLVLNREEATLVGGGDHEDVHDQFDKLHALGPKIVVITDGPNGAYASDGQQRFQMPLYPDPAPPVDRTGAGDSFASTFVAALMKGNTIEGALQWAPINSMSVVQKVGAQAGLLTEDELDHFLKHSPDWYKPTPM